MQTIPMDPKLVSKAMHQLPPSRIEPLPMPPMPFAPSTAASQAARSTVQINPYAEIDAMLIRNPNTGAIHGLRFALLFNAGLALSGLLGWELWITLAH